MIMLHRQGVKFIHCTEQCYNESIVIVREFLALVLVQVLTLIKLACFVCFY